MAVENDVKTIAFPAISTGVYNFPIKKAAKIAIREVEIFLAKNDEIEMVIFICFNDEPYDTYKNLLNEKKLHWE